MHQLYGLPIPQDDQEQHTAAAADWQRCIHPDDLLTLKQALLHSVRQQEPLDIVFRVRQASGEERYIHAAALVEREG